MVPVVGEEDRSTGSKVSRVCRLRCAFLVKFEGIMMEDYLVASICCEIGVAGDASANLSGWERSLDKLVVSR